MTDNSLFTFKMGGFDEITTTDSQNFKSSSNGSGSGSSNSIERHNTNNNVKTTSNGPDLKRYLKNFMLFSNLEIESEKKCRDEQLSKIVKALMLFEKKLRKEQEVIQQQLCEKDRVINRQMHTITNMKVKLGVEQFNDGDDNDDEDDVTSTTAEFCPMCRKKYYLRATKSVPTQTNLKGFSNIISDGEFNFIFILCAKSKGGGESSYQPNFFFIKKELLLSTF